jgi:hypothetical protein
VLEVLRVLLDLLVLQVLLDLLDQVQVAEDGHSDGSSSMAEELKKEFGCEKNFNTLIIYIWNYLLF